MSGDVQPRKRKDKRRKKDDLTPEPPLGKRSLSTESEGEESHGKSHSHSGDKGENIHVHHDHGIGGNAFVKIIFFALLAVLLGLVGVIFFESRGSTDVDLPSIEDSRFSEYFTGWLDDAPDDHGHDDAVASGEAEEEHDDHDEHDEHEEHSEEPEDEEGDGHSEAEEEEESAATEEDRQDTEEGDNEGNSDELAADSNAEDENSEEDENTAEEDMEDEDENASTEEVEEEEENTDEDDEDNESTEVDDESEAEEEEEEEEEDFDLTQEDESGDEEPEIVKKNKSVEKDQSESEGDENDDKDKKENDEEEEEEIKTKEEISEESAEAIPIRKAKKFDESEEEEIEEIEESDEALKEEEEAVKKEKLSLMDDDENLSDISDLKTRKRREKELIRKLEKMLKEQEKKNEMKDENEEENGGEDGAEETKETGGVALKLGVGVALVITAHVVLVRRWRALTHATDEGDEEAKESTDEAAVAEEPVVSRRQTLIPETVEIPTFDKEEEVEEELEEDEYSEDEVREAPIKRRTSTDVKLERQDPNKYYTKEELGDSEDLDDEEELGEEEELVEEEVEEEELGEEEEDDYELEGSQTPSDLGDAEEEEEEEEEEAAPVPPARVSAPPPRRGPQDFEDEFEFEEAVLLGESTAEAAAEEEEELEETKETLEESVESKLSDDDWLFRQELNFADDQLLNNGQSALDAYTRVLASVPDNVRALIGRARALDRLAEERRSNVLLGQAVDEYQKLLTDAKYWLSDVQFKELAEQCIKRMKFAGRNLQSVAIYNALISRFPQEVEHRNGLAISYLIGGRNNDALRVLDDTLVKWPNDGVALVHIGFILKNNLGKMKEGAEMLERGLRTNQSGTLDGRFFFHLGDALHRLGRNEEASTWYELGVERGLFKSKYQRSLYNVDRLKAQPWWPLEDTPYQQFFRNLEKNWKKIREEGLTLLRARDAKLFQDEAESLRDTGDWKQLDLFSRGRKQAGCSRAPFTCGLIGSFASAATCTRGQAKFSVMEPGTHVWAHCGPTNCRLRAHLGLVVPTGVHLRVAQQTKSWKEGKVFVFDDSFEHEVWHNGSSVRLVLIVDVWHPELTQHERQTLSPI